MGEATFNDFVRRAALQIIDLLWVEHLEAMDYMRSSVNLRAYGQRDPLVEYKREGLSLFKAMQISFEEQLVSLIEGIGQGTEKLSFVQERSRLEEVKEDALLIGGESSKKPPRLFPMVRKPGAMIRVRAGRRNRTKRR